MNGFAVGDVCEIVHASEYPQFVGLECTIVALSKLLQGEFIIEVPDLPPNMGRYYTAPPYCLRKRKPPPDYDGNTVTKWDDVIVWQPNRETA